MSDYSADTNKLGNAVGIPFAANQTGSGMLDLAFSADDISRMNSMFWLDGIKTEQGDLGNNGSVEWVNGMNVIVRPFRAHLNGTIVFSEQVSLTIEREDDAARIDSVIVRRDYLERTVDVMVLKGVPGSSQPPVLAYNDGGIADLELARIIVRPGMEALSQPDITDMRRPLAADLGIRPGAANKGEVLYVGDNGIKHGGRLPRVAKSGEVLTGKTDTAEPVHTMPVLTPAGHAAGHKYEKFVFTESGTFTPKHNCYARVSIVDGGQGGGGASVTKTTGSFSKTYYIGGSSGKSGAVFACELRLKKSDVYDIVVGAGGNGAAAVSNSNASAIQGAIGGNSSFAELTTAGSRVSNVSNSRAGSSQGNLGATAGVLITYPFFAPGGVYYNGTTSSSNGGNGANADSGFIPWCILHDDSVEIPTAANGARASGSSGLAGRGGYGFGAGGGGAASHSSGGNGAPGVVVIETWLIPGEA